MVFSFVRDGSNAVSVSMTDYVLDSGLLGNLLFGMRSTGAIETTAGSSARTQWKPWRHCHRHGVVYDLDITNFAQGQLDSALTGVELVLGP